MKVGDKVVYEKGSFPNRVGKVIFVGGGQCRVNFGPTDALFNVKFLYESWVTPVPDGTPTKQVPRYELVAERDGKQRSLVIESAHFGGRASWGGAGHETGAWGNCYNERKQAARGLRSACAKQLKADGWTLRVVERYVEELA